MDEQIVWIDFELLEKFMIDTFKKMGLNMLEICFLGWFSFLILWGMRPTPNHRNSMLG